MTEADIGILDSVTLVPVVWMLLSQMINHHVAYKTPEKHKERSGIVNNRWQFSGLAVLSLIAGVLYVVGCVVAFRVERLLPHALRAGVVLCSIVGLGILACACFTPKGSKRVEWPLISLFAGAGVVRFVWAIGCAWAAEDSGARFDPLRHGAVSTWTNLGMVVVMEFVLCLMCLWVPGKYPDFFRV
jgi:hypothetical protein